MFRPQKFDKFQNRPPWKIVMVTRANDPMFFFTLNLTSTQTARRNSRKIDISNWTTENTFPVPRGLVEITLSTTQHIKMKY